jgi:hypothetical protein
LNIERGAGEASRVLLSGRIQPVNSFRKSELPLS